MATANDASDVRIGWASRDITPPRPCPLHGQFYTRVSEGAADPLTLTALALESESSAQGGQAILVSCDLVGVWAHVQARVRDEVRRRLKDFDADLLLMGATHTHCGPTLVNKWYEPQPPPVMTTEESVAFFVGRAAGAVEEAWKKRAPGGVSWAYTHAVVGHNRRAVYRDGSARMYGKTRDPLFECFEGYEDHGLDLLCTWDAGGELSGVIVNLACPSQVSEHEMKFTADFWHETRGELRKRLGGGLFILPQCAPAGDQSPHLLVYKEVEALMLQRRGLTTRQEIARRIATAVEDVLPLAKADIRRQVVLRHLAATLPLPSRRVTQEENAQARAEVARLEADPQADVKIRYAMLERNRRVAQRFDQQGDSPVHPVEVHVARLGDVAFATNPFECYLDFGLRIKANSPATQTFCVQLAAGYEGYLPTARAVRGGHYGAEIASNNVGPEGGQMLVDRTLEMMKQLWA